MFKPPEIVDPKDKHGGFTAITTLDGRKGPNKHTWRRMPASLFLACLINHRFTTLWRPGQFVEGNVSLVAAVKAFYQNNNDVTLAVYSDNINGYGYLIATWWDNKTGERIA